MLIIPKQTIRNPWIPLSRSIRTERCTGLTRTSRVMIFGFLQCLVIRRPDRPENMNREKYPWLYDVLFLLVFLLAGYLRLTGLDWGQGGGQHPDENFFSGVLESLRTQSCLNPRLPVEVCPPNLKHWMSIGDYFNSATSSLNPYNRGFSFYVYGDLPMTIIRIAADATNQTNFREFGRAFSAVADLFAVFFLYLLVSHLYGRRVGLLASLFSALTVMQIQQAHFFTVDLFVNTFAFLALWFAVEILETKEPPR